MFLVTDDVETRVGMRLCGVDGVLAKDEKSALEGIAAALSDDNVCVLLITQGIRDLCPERVSYLGTLSKPVLCEIPDSKNAGHTKGSLSDYIKNAVGISI